MNKKKSIFGYTTIACLVVFLGLFGAISLYGQDHDQQEHVEEKSRFLYDSFGIIDTIHTPDDILITADHPDFDILLIDIETTGNIVIASDYDGRVLFHNTDISGMVMVSGTGLVELTLSNSSIESIVFNSIGKVNVLSTAEGAMPPNVVVNFPGVHLLGNFDRVESNIRDGVIYIDGNIGGLYAQGNVILVGAGSIVYTVAPAGTIVEIFNPNRNSQDLDELVALLDALFLHHIGRLELNLMYGFEDLFDGIGWPDFNFPQTSIQVVQSGRTTTSRPTPTPSPPPYEPTMTPPPSPSPTPGPGNSNGGSIPDPTIFAVNINNIMPPNNLPSGLFPAGVTANVQRSGVGGNGFSGTIEWRDQNNRLVGNVFESGMEYIAEITLTPNSGEYFAPNTAINITTIEGLHHNRDNTSISHDKIVFTLHFNPVGTWPAQAFSLRPIEGTFSQIHVHTHYLGQPDPGNFEVIFGGSPVAVTSVSTFNQINGLVDGYYVLTLAAGQPADGRQLSVKMTGTLYHHAPYFDEVIITPAQGATVTTNPVAQGGRVSLSGFPASPNYHIFVSLIPLDENSDTLLYASIGLLARIDTPSLTNPANQYFYLPSSVLPGLHRVYLGNDMVFPPTITPVEGALEVTAASGLAGWLFDPAIALVPGDGAVVEPVEIDIEPDDTDTAQEPQQEIYVPLEYLE